ncbi:MAG: sigma-54-dependent Fis family transcriptional regulator, partial [Gammaproteobacteria bacterium]|nr:sigma-54-dependent Fis family transcriptional regulator [Gammaproteobacteria bacterium]
WIGAADIKGAHGNDNPGPIKATILNRPKWDEIVLLSNYSDRENEDVVAAISQFTHAKFFVKDCSRIRTVTDYESIYREVDSSLQFYCQNSQVSVLLSPGTPQMHAVWLLITQTRYPQVELLSSYNDQLSVVKLPFSVSAELIPLSDSKLTDISTAPPPSTAQFSDILGESPQIKLLKERAAVLAQRDLPVLILGESGTGKELFARAIHNSSLRAEGPWRVINCGAIPPELIDSILFGHKKGSFTGAYDNQPGLFEEANSGTLFLDEIGELPLNAQVRLLRVLQESKVTRVGESKEQKVDLRIIAATHRNLLTMINEGTFREDLFFRIAVGVLEIPPLREREGDLIYLSENLLKYHADQQKRKCIKISPKAKNVILNYSWPGNVRELNNTLLRASIWLHGLEIQEEDIRQALFRCNQSANNGSDIMSRDIGNGFDIKEILNEVEAHYVQLAWKKSEGQLKKASQLLGYKNHQTYSDRKERYGIT